jgi:hypothetical protein
MGRIARTPTLAEEARRVGKLPPLASGATFGHKPAEPSTTVTEGEDEDDIQRALEAIKALNSESKPEESRYNSSVIHFDMSEQDMLSLHDPMHAPIVKTCEFAGCELVGLDGGVDLDTEGSTLSMKVITRRTGSNSSATLLLLGYSSPLWMPPTPVSRPWETTEPVATDCRLLGKTFLLTRY